MKIIPAISIMEGQVVEARGGSYHILRGVSGEIINPRDFLLELKKEFGIVCVLDIDGIERNMPDLKSIQKFSTLMPVWTYAGSRDIMGTMDVLVAGASKAIIGTQHLLEMGLLKEAHDMTDNIIISFDHESCLLCPSKNLQTMGIREMAREIKKIGIETALFFDLGRISQGGDLGLEEIRILQENFKETYVAGILSPTEIARLAEMEVSGIIADFKSLREWGIKGDPDDWNGGDVDAKDDNIGVEEGDGK